MKTLFALCLLWSTLATAYVDPSIEWKTMHLQHFDLIYDAKHQGLAEIYAARLEDNVRVLKTYFSIIPERTTVVLNDRTDLTNGYATALPYSHIVLYPVLPGPNESIGEYGDWARELSMHEYTHILSMEPKSGFMKGLRYVFGTVITPNMLLPRWFLEGVAVDLETRTSNAGRLRSTLQDGALRAFVLDDSLMDFQLAEINETTIHTWPQGMRPYLFGSLLWNQMIAEKGTQTIDTLHQRYGGRVPYFISAPVYDTFDKNYEDLFAETKTEVEKRAQAQISALKKVASPVQEKVPLTGEENFLPAISPDGKRMIYLSKDDANKRSIKVLQRTDLSKAFDRSQTTDTLKEKLIDNLDELRDPRSGDLPPGGTIQRLAWFPDSTRFIFDKLYERSRFQEVSDLYIFDLQKEKTEQITFGLRAREAAVSPDGKKAAFVKLDAGKTSLALLDLSTKSVQTLLDGGYQSRYSFPTFISDEELVFSVRNGKEDELWKINTRTRARERLFSDYGDAKLPQQTEAGLLFISNQNGVNNLYLSTDLKTARPVTHSLTSVSSSSWDPARKELYVTELTSKGQHIFRLNPANSQLPAKLPRIEPLLQDRFPAVDTTVAELKTPAPEEYSPWSYLLPRYWFPSLLVNEEGVYFAAATSAQDPLMKHSYSLSAGYDSDANEGTYAFLYNNSSWTPLLSIQAFEITTQVGYSSYEYRNRDYLAQSLWQIPQLSSDLYAGLGWSWLSRDIPTGDADSTGPYVLLNYFDATQSGAQISPESGQGVSLRVTDYLDQGEREHFYQYRLSLQKYFSRWLPSHHVIFARALAQYIDQDVTLPNYESSFNYDIYPNLLTPFFVARGFTNGQFLGKSLANYTLEYRFPIAYPYRGAGTTPLFIKKFHAAMVVDGIQVDGFSYNVDQDVYQRVPRWQVFWSAGLELKADVTLGYLFPLTVYTGFYVPLQEDFQNDPGQFALGIQL